MKRIVYSLIGIVLSAAAVSGGFFVSVAEAGPACVTQVTLSAPGAGSFEFGFEGSDTFGDTFAFSLADGESDSGFTPAGATATITEAPQDGYIFGGIECEAGPGVVISEIDGGFTINCVNAFEGTASCVITNVPASRPIPTLSEWGMIAAAAGLGLVGVWFALKRKKAQIV